MLYSKIILNLPNFIQQIEGETGSSGPHRRHLVKAAQCLEPDVRVNVIAVVQEQMTAIIDRELGMALESDDLTAYPE